VIESGTGGFLLVFDNVFSRLDTMHQRDGRTDTGRQQRPRLITCIALR